MGPVKTKKKKKWSGRIEAELMRGIGDGEEEERRRGLLSGLCLSAGGLYVVEYDQKYRVGPNGPY